MALYNKLSKEELKKKLEKEPFQRVTLSFYRYVILEDIHPLRDELFGMWEQLGVLGRIYIAREGINAQLSVPEHNLDSFRQQLYAYACFNQVPLKIAIEDDGKSFYKLIVRVRQKLVGDGLDDGHFDVTNVGKHMNAEEFNAAASLPGSVVVDMRNHYESEVGHFENAILPQADTFRDELPLVANTLKDKKETKILLYCTGGIRCEKASAYLKHHGFADVNQLYGGIIEYVRQVREKGLKSKFIGKNFVFDSRMGERVTEDVISSCHQCGKACDRHVNCANDDCHLLFIQCDECSTHFKGCCTPECVDVVSLPEEEQKKMRKGKKKESAHAVYKSRLRPNLREILNNPQSLQSKSDL